MKEESRPTPLSDMEAIAKLQDKETIALAKACFRPVQQDLWLKDGVLFGRQAALQNLGESARKELYG